MLDTMLLPFRRYAEFSGRSRRKEYWLFALLQAIVGAVLFGLVVLSWPGLFTGEQSEGFSALGLFFGVLAALWFLASFIPSLAVSIRRLHDRDMSGWWYLGFVIASAIPVVGFIASIAMLVIMVLPGTPGDNRFGPDPKLGTAAAI